MAGQELLAGGVNSSRTEAKASCPQYITATMEKGREQRKGEEKEEAGGQRAGAGGGGGGVAGALISGSQQGYSRKIICQQYETSGKAFHDGSAYKRTYSRQQRQAPA